MEKSEEKKPVVNCKVVLIGNSGVGKTSIINRYTIKSFKQTMMSTPGASFLSKTVDFPDYKKSIKFEIWDTAGQERYRALAKTFYKNASSCVLVYDITSRITFEDIKTYWAPELKENGMKEKGKFVH